MMNADYSNPLHVASSKGDLDSIQKLAKKGKLDINAKDGNNQQTALHVACYEGKFDVAYYLVSNGADVNARDAQDWTPLHCGAVQDHLKICAMLLTRGADPNAQNMQKTSPLHYIIRSPYREELIEVLDLMIEHGVNLECKNYFGETPLIQAAAKGLTESVRFLLDHHSNVNTTNTYQQTALHFAVGNGNKDTVLLLLKYGADVAIISQNGTPLDIAVKEGKHDIADILKSTDWTSSTYTAFQKGDEPATDAPFIRAEHHAKFITKADSDVSVTTSDKGLTVSSSTEDASLSPLKESFSNQKISGSNIIKPIVNHYGGFREELGKSNASKERKLLFPPSNYKNWFYHSEHVNFVGRVNRKGSNDKFEPIVVSILPEQNRYRLIIWSRLGDYHTFFTPSAKEKAPKWKSGLPSDMKQHIKQTLLESRPRDKDVDLEFDYEKDLNPFREQLLEFETGDPLRAKCFSVGVLYCKDGQVTEQEQFGNENGSPAFDEFLNWLGDKIPLKGWVGYRGDLDVKTNSTGKYSVFRRWKGFEIMFHVSTLLPYSTGEEQQIHRKRRIGNDIGVIVFQEGGSYTPPIRSQFLHVYYVVSPHDGGNGKTQYKFQVASQEAVPPFGPEIPDPPILNAEKDGRDFLMTKVLNGLLGSLRHPALREKIWCKPREAFLVNLVRQHAKKGIVDKLKEPDMF